MGIAPPEWGMRGTAHGPDKLIAPGKGISIPGIPASALVVELGVMAILAILIWKAMEAFWKIQSGSFGGEGKHYLALFSIKLH